MNAEVKLAVDYRSVDSLQKYPGNPRTHTKHQVRQIAASLKAFGFTNPILVDKTGTIIAGHGRLEAAKLLGLSKVPTILLESLTCEQVRAYAIADNKLAENAGWDTSILAIELQHLIAIENSELDITITGFEVAEVDFLLEKASLPTQTTEVETLPALAKTAISVLGDVWELGGHRVMCGSSLDEENYQLLFGKKRASAVFTDPPYNVKIDGHATGNGAIHHREFAMASGEMTDTDFRAFLNSCLALFVRYACSNAIHYVCIDWRNLQTLLGAGSDRYDHLLNICVWVKDNGGMGSLYRSQHEFVAVFRNGKNTHRNNVQLGKYGRNRTNVWQYPGVQTFSKQSDEGNLLELHPTVKPVRLVADAMLDCTSRGDIVLDGFLGSGTTLMAAERIGRRCFGLEIDPIYVDTIIRRWQNQTGNTALHSNKRKSFDEVAVERTIIGKQSR